MSSPIIKLGITGSIGSGKSYVCALLQQRGIPVFGCDGVARTEMLDNAALRQQIIALVGDGAYDRRGRLVKDCLRRFLCSSPHASSRLNALVHPCVRRRMLHWLSQQSAPVAAVECALLFEAGFHTDLDYVVTVSAPETLRIARVMRRDGLSREKVEAMMALQMPDAEKCKRADVIIRNDETTDLHQQIDALLSRIKFF